MLFPCVPFELLWWPEPIALANGAVHQFPFAPLLGPRRCVYAKAVILCALSSPMACTIRVGDLGIMLMFHRQSDAPSQAPTPNERLRQCRPPAVWLYA